MQDRSTVPSSVGTCGGFQHAVIEYAQNKLGLNDAQHAEYDPDASNLIITALSCSLVGETRNIFINKNSRIYKFYNKTEAEERFSCNFGISPNYRKLIDESGFKVVGTDEKGEARILELPQNKFFIAIRNMGTGIMFCRIYALKGKQTPCPRVFQEYY